MKRVCWMMVLAGCTLPGKPRVVSLEGQPSKVEDFDVLYRSTCAGCHGDAGRGGAALGLANPVYLAIADDTTLRQVISDGVPGTSMPGFAERAGGMLTTAQVDVLVREMRARWARPAALEGATPPPYAGPPGDRERGQAVFATSCASCHGASGTGGPKSRSIVDDSYLALVSPQGLRTLLIAGRPEIGHPDWRGDLPGHPLSSQQIADVVAWLEKHRPEFPGQPYTSSP
jgi:cytochrome c oxidase cbb3-type subunit 3/ubiquinol-cytochrome c reductase cytochrome c subunit